jgi:glycosyltransferase involved in cell wall biosynthesis
MKSTDGRQTVRKDFLPSRALWRILAVHNIRAVLIHEYSPYTLQALLFAKWHRIPLVVFSDIGRKNRKYFRVSTRLWHAFWGRFANGIIACTPAALEPLSGGKRPSIATYHAMDSRVCVPLPKSRSADSPVVFAYLGRLIHLKGLDYFLQAAARLRSQGAGKFTIRLIGGGEEDWVKGWIRDLQLDGIVELTGFLSGEAIRDALATADVFVLPTRQDTYAAVVHEAACMALPLLVSKNAGAAQALVQEGQNGFIFDPAEIDAFAAAMKKLLDPGLRVRMGTLSRSIGERFSAHERGKALWHWLADSFKLSP